MLTDLQQRTAAQKFASEWQNRGYEKGETHAFWINLLRTVLGVSEPEAFISFETQVLLGHTSFIDAYIPETKVMIEQKSLDIDLTKPAKQSDGSFLTPYQQAKRYADELELSKKPRYIVICNFREFHIHDMEHPHAAPEILKLADLPREYHRLSFLADLHKIHLKREMELSIKAGELVGKLYDAILKQYQHPEAEATLKSLNILCVRLVFCLYAEDAGIFGLKNQFHDYLSRFAPRDLRQALIHLFAVLNTKEAERDPYMDEDLAAFPYVNGGLFAESDIEIPRFDDTIKNLLLEKASDDFDWSQISPTIFGAVFESTLNPETRRSGGMHYTSIENIHKVIDPLFLDDLRAELNDILEIKAISTRNKKLVAFQEKLSRLTFLDPACGSGNFLTETYLSLRRLENNCLETIYTHQTLLGLNDVIKVNIRQFYGIEINDFAVTVAKTALWIAESQMMKATEDIVHLKLDFLPLKSYANILEANALRIDWNTLIPKQNLNYIMGNPPFVGNARLSDEQKQDRLSIFGNEMCGDLDYVACWYKKASDYIKNTQIFCAFVSTNSICQGQQVLPLWKSLMASALVINFAHRTFKWESEAHNSAAVFCIIVGFSYCSNKKKVIFDNEKIIDVKNINGYLLDAPNIFIEKRRLPLFNVPVAIKGFQPTDNGYLILNDSEKQELFNKHPESAKWIREFITAREYLHGIKRWCFWLKNITPAEINKNQVIKERVEACRLWRSQQKSTGDAYKLKDMPTLMRPSGKFEEENFVVLPRHSGESRQYVPFGFALKGVIPGDSISLIPNAKIFHFGILISNIHMAWMRAVCGRIKGDYRYTSDIVYNNFPWCEVTEAQKAAIEKTAQGILDARALYPDCSLADLYDETTMPPELRKAHQANDRAVMKAYGYPSSITEPEIVADLMNRYQKLTAK